MFLGQLKGVDTINPFQRTTSIYELEPYSCTAPELSTTVRGGIYHPPPYKNLFKDQLEPIFCIRRVGGQKYHRKIF